MKANLIIELNQITVRGYSLIEEEGLIALLSAHKSLTFTYEDNEEGKGQVFVIDAPSLHFIFNFLHASELPVTIIT